MLSFAITLIFFYEIGGKDKNVLFLEILKKSNPKQIMSWHKNGRIKSIHFQFTEKRKV
jgi:outer membrane lipopolysaccharide assembly protein LptE/RlpB